MAWPRGPVLVIGQSYGAFTVLEFVERRNSRYFYKVRCRWHELDDPNGVVIREQKHILDPRIKSCGCRAKIPRPLTPEGLARKRIAGRSPENVARLKALGEARKGVPQTEEHRARREASVRNYFATESPEVRAHRMRGWRSDSAQALRDQKNRERIAKGDHIFIQRPDYFRKALAAGRGSRWAKVRFDNGVVAVTTQGDTFHTRPINRILDEYLKEPILARDGGACLLCGSAELLCLHHTVMRSVDSSCVFDPNRIGTVCRPCHESKLHSKGWNSLDEVVNARLQTIIDERQQQRPVQAPPYAIKRARGRLSVVPAGSV